MNKDKLESYLSGKKGADGTYPFGPEALVFKVMGKMFALVIQGETPPRVNLKVVPEDGAILTGRFDAISPGYHMNKRHWITITLDGTVPDEMIIDLVGDSYNLVVAKLKKADKEKLDRL